MLGKFQDKALFHEKDYYKEVSIPKLLTQRLMASGGVFLPPLLRDFFVKNFGKLYAYDLLAMSSKFCWLSLKKLLAFLGSYHVTSS